MTETDTAQEKSPPIWPVFYAPLVVLFYYFAIKGAFSQSIVSVFGKGTAMEIDISDIAEMTWGSHWAYRSFAEIVATAFAAFVAAGLAHGREKLAAIVAGCTISLGFLIRIVAILYAWLFREPGSYNVDEPWYQYLIEAIMIFAAPVIATLVVGLVIDIRKAVRPGFGGVSRLHFLWLWIPTYWYALGLITPIAKIQEHSAGILMYFIIGIVHFVPVLAIAVPGYFGLALLSGSTGTRLNRFVRGLAGFLVLIFGFVVGALIQVGWYKMFNALRSAIVD